MRRQLFFFILFLIPALLIPSLHAASPVLDASYKEKINNLESLLKSIDNVAKKISATQKLLQGAYGVGREQEIRSQIQELSLKLRDMEESFAHVAAEVDLSAYSPEKKRMLEWDQELTELLGPVIREVKKMTSHPREVEKLRSKIDIYESQLQVAARAIKNLSTLLSSTDNPRLVEELNKVITVWQNRQLEIGTQMAIASQQLEQKIGKKKPLSESLQELLQIFFKSRGRNLLFAFLAFAFVWVTLHYIHKLIRTFSPFHKQGRSFSVRIFDMLYMIFTLVFSLLALLGVLYSFGDWVLLSIAIIFLIGVGWASKHALPRFWSQVTLMLNFGSVREGEVVIYKGLPYEVTSINIYSVIENKYLEGGFIRLHIKDLVELRSRPAFEKEPWFPSKRGDWVRLSDKTYGKVIAQTPESVQLELLGGAPVTYKTADYLSLSPTNLSSGFRISATFGLDYGHQAIITHEIPDIIQQALIETLGAEGYRESINSIKVEFKEAGPSSLDVAVLADFNKRADFRYAVLERAIQRICVDTCNLHHWVIPFQQVTVHMAQPPSHHG
jgi:hypothetical protein